MKFLMKSVEFGYSNNLIQSLFLTNDVNSLVVAQGDFPNCVLISFFISLIQIDRDIQKRFLVKTIIPGHKDKQSGFYVRKFVPFQLSEDFRFITLEEVNNVPTKMTSYEALLRPHKLGKTIGTIAMCGPLLMRVIEHARMLDMKHENGGQIKPMQIIDYLKQCGIAGEGCIVEGYSKRLDFADHFVANNGIGWVKFDNELIDKNGYLLTNKHCYSVLGTHKNYLIVANPRYYDPKDKRTIIHVDYKTEGLSGFFYIFN